MSFYKIWLSINSYKHCPFYVFIDDLDFIIDDFTVLHENPHQQSNVLFGKLLPIAFTLTYKLL